MTAKIETFRGAPIQFIRRMKEPFAKAAVYGFARFTLGKGSWLNSFVVLKFSSADVVGMGLWKALFSFHFHIFF